MTERTLLGLCVMNTRLTRMTMPAALFAVMIATSMGCGDPTSPTAPTPLTPAAPAPPSPPSPLPTNIVPAAINGEVGVNRSDITMSQGGTATVTLNWPNPDFSLQLYVTSGVCADTISLLTGKCTIMGSTRQGSLPGVVTSPVTGGDRYTIWVLNPDPAPQSFVVHVNIEQS